MFFITHMKCIIKLCPFSFHLNQPRFSQMRFVHKFELHAAKWPTSIHWWVAIKIPLYLRFMCVFWSGQQNSHGVLSCNQFSATLVWFVARTRPVGSITVAFRPIECVSLNDQLRFTTLTGHEHPFGQIQTTATLRDEIAKVILACRWNRKKTQCVIVF